MGMRFLNLVTTLAVTLVTGVGAHASEFALEGGSLFSTRFVLSDGSRPNAAEGWNLGAVPTVRAEYWWNEQNPWKFGLVLLPFYFSTDQKLTGDLTVKGQTFNSGQTVNLKYQFHNLRGTAGYRLVDSSTHSFRIGGSLILRYAELDVSDSSKGGKNTNFLAFPLLFLEYQAQLGESLALVLRGDMLPLGLHQGLYDFLLALEWVRLKDSGPSFSTGIRAFWGGFSPNEQGQNNNEISFIGPVLRARF
jgi:hypothetical protein